MANTMMIEVTGSANKASSALDKVIAKLLTLQQTFDKVTPALDKFTAKMDSIAKSSKAIVTLKSLTDNVNKNTLAAANAESKMAMYQARLDRANVSMERSRASSLKLAEAQKKLKEASNFGTENKQFLDNFHYIGNENTKNKFNSYSAPIPKNVPTMNYDTEKIQQEIDNFASKVSNKEVMPKIDTTQAVESIKKTQSYIDSLRPSISRMSQEAQAEFDKLSAELMRVTNKINNQNAQYHKLAQSATQAARAHGEGSLPYLKLEKQMLTLDGQTDKLFVKQKKLKAQMSGFNVAGVDKYTNAAKRATKQTTLFGREAKKASRHATSGFQRALRMMKNMFIRIIAFRTFSAISKAIADGMNSIAQASNQANISISTIRTSTLYLKNSIVSSFVPLVQSLTPVITQLVDTLAELFNMLGMLNARIFGGATSVVVAKKASVNYAASLAKTGSAAKNTAKSVKELKRSVMGFDELNILSKSAASPMGASAGTPGMPAPKDMFKTVKIPDWVEKIGKFTDPINKVISNWWAGLTDAQRWGAGIGATAGTVIGGIIGHLICPGIGTVLGMMLGQVIGTVIGAWWAGLTDAQRWGAGIGATAGTVIGGIIGHLICPGIGTVLGAALGGVAGGLIGKWWSDLTSSQKWATGIGAGAGAAIGGIIGLMIGGPIGLAVGAILGGTAGTVIGKWWEGLTSKDKWATGIGAGAGAAIGGIIGTIICPGIGTVLGAALGGTAGTLIGKWWNTLKSKQKWSVGSTGIGAVVGSIIGTILLGPLGTILGGAIGGVAGNLIEKFWDYLTNINHWKIGKGAGVGAAICGIIGAVIGGPLGAAVGAALGGMVGSGIEHVIKRHAKGTAYHLGGPAIVNDAPGSVYRELVQFPNGKTFIPNERNALIPNLPVGSKVLPAQETNMLFPNYASGIGKIDFDKLLVPVATSNSAELETTLNFKTYSSANSGASDSHSSSNDYDTDRIVESISQLKSAIQYMEVILYADDREIANSANRGNARINRRFHPVAST